MPSSTTPSTAFRGRVAISARKVHISVASSATITTPLSTRNPACAVRIHTALSTRVTATG
ncbi:hypothetical protein DOU02_15730 [Clavibacter michiganensis subsp. michiganensis]|nr:hypothetical protein DOU02_15730 [Clavibacter michiganensis subsp. michiganensis]OUD89745.1 hypothetical protein CMMCAS05_12995 [Clavibacter michiganensis subsp. michiganensis]